MTRQSPLREILIATRELWDHSGTRPDVRETFLKVIACGTIALGAEVYASATQRKIVYHTCKSRFCPSCGQRATEAWREDLEATLPDIAYIGVTLTMPREFWLILQQNRHLLYGMPAMGAEAIQQWIKARYGVRVIVIVVQHTFGGFLNFYPHLHVLVSAGGLRQSAGQWVTDPEFGEKALPRFRTKGALVRLMRAWRFAVINYLATALNGQVLRSELSDEELRAIFKTQYERTWHVHITRTMSKAHFLRYVGRYIRRPPIAQHRLQRVADGPIEYLAKDTRNSNQLVRVQYSNEHFLAILKEQVQDRGRHVMRYFGLLAPRSKAQTWVAVFLALGQKQRSHPRRSGWRWLLRRTFGIDPLRASDGTIMQWVRRLSPSESLVLDA